MLGPTCHLYSRYVSVSLVSSSLTFNLADLLHLGYSFHKVFSFATLSLLATPPEYQRSSYNATVFFVNL